VGGVAFVVTEESKTETAAGFVDVLSAIKSKGVCTAIPVGVGPTAKGFACTVTAPPGVLGRIRTLTVLSPALVTYANSPAVSVVTAIPLGCLPTGTALPTTVLPEITLTVLSPEFATRTLLLGAGAIATATGVVPTRRVVERTVFPLLTSITDTVPSSEFVT
jgi:hypothetical protein